MSDTLLPVTADPFRGPDWIGWDVAFDCRVSFGVEPSGLVVAVAGEEGMTIRVVTPEQVRDFARKLLALADSTEVAS